jgi:hypothetical protein
MPIFDADAVARATAAVAEFSDEFEGWLAIEIEKLQSSRLAAESSDWSSASLISLYAAAHELKGVGTTYGYPLATAISGLLCTLIENQDTAIDRVLACAHVDALRAIARDGINADHPAGAALANELQRRVAAVTRDAA